MWALRTQIYGTVQQMALVLSITQNLDSYFLGLLTSLQLGRALYRLQRNLTY